jgi:hypothetical protein
MATSAPLFADHGKKFPPSGEFRNYLKKAKFAQRPEKVE